MLLLYRVLHWVLNAGATANTQIMNEISQCVESLNGVKDGKWKSIITFYKPITLEQSMVTECPRDFLGISIPDQPSKYYFMICGQRIIFEADSNIQTIMEKLQSYKSRVSLNFEGIQYQIGDFQLRVGKVSSSHSESMRGIVMEVEYLPLSSIDKSRQVLVDFVAIWKETLSKRSLPGQFMHMEPNYRVQPVGSVYFSAYRSSICRCHGATDCNRANNSTS